MNVHFVLNFYFVSIASFTKDTPCPIFFYEYSNETLRQNDYKETKKSMQKNAIWKLNVSFYTSLVITLCNQRAFQFSVNRKIFSQKGTPILKKVVLTRQIPVFPVHIIPDTLLDEKTLQ